MSFDEGGGASSRRGMEYQDYATAYYALTNKPAFQSLETRPLQFRIEQRNCDFSFTIQHDDYNTHHFFEAKRWKNHITWKTYRDDILDEFAEALDQEVEDGDTAHFHLVTNASLNTSLRAFFSDTEKLRRGDLDWNSFDSKHDVRNKSVFELHTDLETNREFHKLAWGLTVHHHTKKELESEFQSFVRDCSPRTYTRPTTDIINYIHEKDNGLITREDLEQHAEVRLNPLDSSDTSKDPSTIKSKLDGIAKEDTHIGPEGIFAKQDTVAQAGDYLVEQEDTSERVVENHVSSMDESLNNISEAWNLIEQETVSLKERSKLLRDKVTDDEASSSE